MIDVEFDDNSGVIFTLSGPFSFNEIEASHHDLFKNPLFPMLKYWIIDRTKTVAYDMTAEQVKKLSHICTLASEKNKSLTQILIAASDVEFGMGRMFEVYESEFGWSVKNFRDMPSAEEWLSKNISS